MWQPKALRPSSFEQCREKGESKRSRHGRRQPRQRERNIHVGMQWHPRWTFLQQKCIGRYLRRKSLWGAHRAYAIMDDQSNASIISIELADKLNADGPEWKYFLSTFGSNREVSVTRNDYDVSLSIDDRRFTKIMDKGIHKNQLGSWEMPLPFCSTNVFMPNKRS